MGGFCQPGGGRDGERRMKPAPFDYARPTSIGAALQLLSERSPAAKILAGGQSLVPMMNFRVVRPDRLIDINRISELDYLRDRRLGSGDWRPLPSHHVEGVGSSSNKRAP